MKRIPKDYKPPEGESTIEPGVYTTTGITWTTVTKDDAKNPILISHEKIEGMFARLTFTLEGSDKKPRMGLVFLPDMPLLALAFGGEDLPDLPDETKAGQVTDYMKQIAAITNKGKTEIYVGKEGDVRIWNVTGARIPDSYYHWRLVGFRKNYDPERYWKEPPWGEKPHMIEPICEIVGDKSGKPSMFNGCRFSFLTPYGMEVVDDKLDWVKDEEGNWRGEAVQAMDFYELMVPDYFEDFQPDDTNDTIPYWIKRMGGLPGPVVSSVVKTMKSKKSDFRYYVIETPELSDVEVEVKTVVEREEEVLSDDDLDKQARIKFGEMMNFLADDIALISGEFTDPGKLAAGKYLTPLKESGKIKGCRPSKMTLKYITGLVKELLPTMDEDDKQPMIRAYEEWFDVLPLGMQDNVNFPEIEEVDDSPF